MEKKSQRDNEAFARHISSVVQSRMAFVESAANSDVGTDYRFWFQAVIETDRKPISESKSGKLYRYHDRPILQARSAASHINKLIKKEKI